MSRFVGFFGGCFVETVDLGRDAFFGAPSVIHELFEVLRACEVEFPVFLDVKCAANKLSSPFK